MERFAGFEDTALDGRLARLRRTGLDLEQRVQMRIVEAQREGRWVPSDPLYQRLSSTMKQVRKELHEAEAEKTRRTSSSPGARDSQIAAR